jgi:hypothetical protein
MDEGEQDMQVDELRAAEDARWWVVVTWKRKRRQSGRLSATPPGPLPWGNVPGWTARVLRDAAVENGGRLFHVRVQLNPWPEQ